MALDGLSQARVVFSVFRQGRSFGFEYSNQATVSIDQAALPNAWDKTKAGAEYQLARAIFKEGVGNNQGNCISVHGERHSDL
jgi:hypothetical protein